MSAALEPLERATALAPRWYTRPEHYARELERVFRRDWLCFGREGRGNMRSDATEEEAEGFRAVVDAIHQEDIRACTSVQQGLRSALATPGRLSQLEKCNWQFQRWLTERIGE